MSGPRHGFQWDERMYDKLDRLVREGLSTPIIATRLGCNSATVLAHWRKLQQRREAATTLEGRDR